MLTDIEAASEAVRARDSGSPSHHERGSEAPFFPIEAALSVAGVLILRGRAVRPWPR
jgi:hypothetical protein